MDGKRTLETSIIGKIIPDFERALKIITIFFLILSLILVVVQAVVLVVLLLLCANSEIQIIDIIC